MNNSNEPIETFSANNTNNNNVNTTNNVETFSNNVSQPTNVSTPQSNISSPQNNVSAQPTVSTQPTTNTPPNNLNDQNLSKAKKERKKINPRKIIALFITVAIIGLISTVGYLYLRAKTPEELLDSYSKSFSDALNAYIVVNKNEIDLLEDDVKLTSNIEFTTTNPSLTSFNNIKLSYTAAESLKNEYMEANVALTQGDANLSLNAFLKQNEAVVEFVNIDNGLIKYIMEENPFDEIKDFADEKLSKEDIKYIMDKGFKYFCDALKESGITMDKSFKEVSYHITLNDENKKKVNNKFNELIKADEKFNSIIKEEIDLFSSFDRPSYSYYGEEPKSNDIVGNLTIDRFTKKIQKFDLTYKDDKISGERTSNYVFEIKSSDSGKIVLTEKEKARDFVTYDKNDKKLGSGSINWSFKDLSYSFKSEDGYSYDFTLTKVTDTKSTFVANYKYKDVKMDANFESNESDNKTDVTGSINFNASNYDYRIDVNQTMEFGKDLVTSKELKEAKDVNSYTDEEQQKLTEAIGNKLTEFDFYKYLTDQLNGIYGSEDTGNLT